MLVHPMLGQKLKHYRKLHDMTQEELASVIGVDSVHIANIEHGRKGISLDKMVLICKHFHIGLSDLLPLDEQDDSDLRKKWSDEILSAIGNLDIIQLGIVKTMICSLLSE